jgi:hypothetical protein
MPDASFSGLGSSSSYFLSISFASTGWTTGASYATVTVADQIFTCTPGNTCSKPGGITFSLCKTNIEISPAVIAAASGTLIVRARIDNANVMLTPCKYRGSGIYAQYTIQGSHPLPTLAPTIAPPTGQGETQAPSLWPTIYPTAPSPAPTQFPTYTNRILLSKSASTSSLVISSSYGARFSAPTVRFTGLGTATSYYLTVGVYGTGFGANSDSEFYYATVKVNGVALPFKCNPGNSCPNPQRSDCIANYAIDPSGILPASGGSLTLDLVTTGVSFTQCFYNGSALYVTYTLSGSQPMPTLTPSVAPTPAALGAVAGLALSRASINEVITGTGALFYVIASIAVLFAALALLAAQIKQKRPHLSEQSLFESVTTTALIGASFASEMFLFVAMLGTVGCVPLGVVAILGRFLHAPAAFFLLRLMFGKKKTVATTGKAAPPLGDLLDQDLILQSSKLFGMAAIFSLVDVTVLRLFPWLSSPFSRKADYPTGRVFLVCVCTKLLQSVVTVSCQVSYFVLVNAAVTADTPQARQSLAFLLINLTVTILLVVLNAFEFVMMRGILLSGALSTLPDSQSVQHQHQQPRLSWIQGIRRSLLGSVAIKDEVPEPVAAENPLCVPASFAPSLVPRAAAREFDVEMAARTSPASRLHTGSAPHLDGEFEAKTSARLLALEAQVASIVEQLQQNSANQQQ